jgi:methyl-accepting chemotaxis protein
MEQVQKSIDDVTKTLADVSEIANESVVKSRDGADTVGKAVEAINLISESSDRIAGIINVISDIADQTNLLALNASIEAARAGEHGRGFAVVADEVSKLADRSASSTKEIEDLIKDSEKNVKVGVELAQESKTSMEQITEGAQKSADMIKNLSIALDHQVTAIKELSDAINSINEMSQSIGAATEEQTTNAKQTSKAIEDVNEITQQAASAAEEMAASTEELSGMAQQLQGLVAQFKLESEQKDINTISSPKELPKNAKEVTDITLKKDVA